MKKKTLTSKTHQSSELINQLSHDLITNSYHYLTNTLVVLLIILLLC